MKKYLPILVFIFGLTNYAAFGQVGIGTTEPDPSAALDLQSTNQGLLLPRLTEQQRNNILNPAPGLIVWCSDCGASGELQVFNGTTWTNFIGGEASAQWICGNPFVDMRDFKIYETVLIGTHCWMAENLNVGKRINGNSNQTDNGIIEKYCYNDLESNCEIYGGLYQWDEAMQYSTQQGVRGICPPGWHIPTDDEWTVFTNYVKSMPNYLCNNNPPYIAKSLAATTNWNTSSNTCAIGNDLTANNATGFTALPAGYRSTAGSFFRLGEYSNCWSSTEYSSSNAYIRGMMNIAANVSRQYNEKPIGFSLRCHRDE